jgi:hypothetical protein
VCKCMLVVGRVCLGWMDACSSVSVSAAALWSVHSVIAVAIYLQLLQVQCTYRLSDPGFEVATHMQPPKVANISKLQRPKSQVCKPQAHQHPKAPKPQQSPNRTPSSADLCNGLLQAHDRHTPQPHSVVSTLVLTLPHMQSPAKSQNHRPKAQDSKTPRTQTPKTQGPQTQKKPQQNPN